MIHLVEQTDHAAGIVRDPATFVFEMLKGTGRTRELGPPDTSANSCMSELEGKPGILLVNYGNPTVCHVASYFIRVLPTFRQNPCSAPMELVCLRQQLPCALGRQAQSLHRICQILSEQMDFNWSQFWRR